MVIRILLSWTLEDFLTHQDSVTHSPGVLALDSLSPIVLKDFLSPIFQLLFNYDSIP
ncbi:MAG: hypothetical protein JST36_02585 [Bacteroidetes bacterium]|nr:hypothetical protein [Bacteroidota bacterium]